MVVTVSMRNILRRSRFQLRKSEKPQQLEFATHRGLFYLHICCCCPVNCWSTGFGVTAFFPTLKNKKVITHLVTLLPCCSSRNATSRAVCEKPEQQTSPA